MHPGTRITKVEASSHGATFKKYTTRENETQ